MEFGPVFCKESHCSEKGIYPFSISEEFLGKNPQIPNMDSCGIYLLDLGTYQVTRAVDSAKILDMVGEAGYTPHTIYHIHESCAAESFGHCCDDAFKCKRMSTFGALGCVELNTGKTHFIPDKPVHQLWYDDTTYMATRQYFDGKRIEMETSRIQRFSMDGETLETLGGVGNHIDGSKNRQWFVGDRAYPGYPADVLLYKREKSFPRLFWGHPMNSTPFGI